MMAWIAIALAVLYFGLLYAAPTRAKPVAKQIAVPTEPAVFRNTVIGLVAFFLLDAVVFHSGLYLSLVEPRSHTGRVAAVLRAQQQRALSGEREILVLGDSRMELGFSEEMANAITAGSHVIFRNAAVPASPPRLWYYLLRELDPSANRYQAIVLPLKIDRRDANVLIQISQALPVLRYTDAGGFASSFELPRDRLRAFAACLLRGWGFHADALDFFAHPLQRISRLREPAAERRQPEDTDVVGIEYDPVKQRIRFPERLASYQRNSLRRAAGLARRASCSGNCYDWTKRILHKYDGTATSVVLVHMPRGPLATEISASLSHPSEAAEVFGGHQVVLSNPQEFAFLEQPAYYADGVHLNKKGQQEFTRRLTEDVLAQLGSQSRGRLEAVALTHPMKD
jgi:hypothetical protein